MAKLGGEKKKEQKAHQKVQLNPNPQKSSPTYPGEIFLDPPLSHQKTILFHLGEGDCVSLWEGALIGTTPGALGT